MGRVGKLMVPNKLQLKLTSINTWLSPLHYQNKVIETTKQIIPLTLTGQ